MRADDQPFVTLTLNPAWDLTLSVAGALRPNGVHTVTAQTVTAGGKGINVAKMLAANAKRVVAGGLLGPADTDRFGEYLAGMGIVPSFLIVPGTVRTNLMVCASDGEMKFNCPGFPCLDYDAERLLSYVADLAATAGVMILSGSLPARFPADTYGRLITALQNRGCPVALDTAGEALTQSATAAACLIKPNRLELEQLTGATLASDAAVERMIWRLRAQHEVVIVSDGRRGAWFAAGDVMWRGNSPDVARVVDTTGAGDALLGQFCADYFPCRHVTASLVARALAAGAAAVEQAGTPQLSLQRVLQLATQVRVERCRV